MYGIQGKLSENVILRSKWSKGVSYADIMQGTVPSWGDSTCKDPEEESAWAEWEVKIWRGDQELFPVGTEARGEEDGFY